MFGIKQLTTPRLLGGVAVYGVGTLAAYEFSRPIPPLPSCGQRCCTFSSLAPKYDAEIEKDEKSSGILDLRKELAAQARGRVLEVAGGTGRNLAYYGSGVDELVVSDYSEAMLQVAARKVAELRAAAASSSGGGDGGDGGDGGAATAPPSKLTLAVTDACALPMPSAHFDTVVDTFGLCSFERPEDALSEMRRCCKPGGRILLLEHGESDWAALAWWQKHRLNRHVVKWGCFWNRDILKLVRESGLHVKEVRRKHLGTTYLIVAEADAAVAGPAARTSARTAAPA